MSTARENFELAQQRYAATFERHLDNGVNFISDNVCICLLYTSDAADE